MPTMILRGDIMLPRQIERLQKKLIKWGYSPRLVEFMEPWNLLCHYNYQIKKQEKMAAAIADNAQEEITIVPDQETAVVEHKKEDDKYKGVKVPYRW